MKKILITAALPYANGFLHLGGMASTYIPSDVFARYQRLKGNKVIFACATDEHGTPIELNALKNNLKPLDFVKAMRKEQKKDMDSLGMSFDSFHMTHSKENKELTDMFFRKAKEKGYIFEKEIKALYCSNDHRFLPDRYVKGTCPFCKAEHQYGDQCEVCGKTYTTLDLIKPYCTLCGKSDAISHKDTKHYFFKLSAYSKNLEKWLNSREIQKDIKNYVLNWIKDGLKDWDITRDKPYFGLNILDEKDKYYYVWFDAPVGYMSSSMKASKNYEDFWKNGEVYHFIGKDIAYHHFLFWPAMLEIADFKMPTNVFTRGYLTIDGRKMSKSKGTFITVREALSLFPADYFRFYFTINTPDNTQDVDFTWGSFKDVINKQLLGDFGNFINRVLTFIVNNFEGKVKISKGMLSKKLEKTIHNYQKNMDKALNKKALEEVMSFVRECNAYFNDKEPWKLIKDNKKKAELILGETLYVIGGLCLMLEPVIPSIIADLKNMISVTYNNNFGFEIEGKVNNIKTLIKKIEDKDIEILSGKDISSFIDLRVAKIIEVEEHPDADKLYVMKLSLGYEERQVVSGIKDYYKPEELLGKKVVLIYNLKKAKIRGIESQGMILAAGDKDVGLVLSDSKEGKSVSFLGIPSVPKKEIDIKDFLKIKMKTNSKGGVSYKNKELVVKEPTSYRALKVDRFEKIGEGKEIR